jgi:hypothetical protein
MDSELFEDIHVLFAHFNRLYFGGRLGGTTVEWSSRLTLCAGICYLRSQSIVQRLGNHQTDHLNGSSTKDRRFLKMENNSSTNYSKYCIIRLSAPILQFRPFSDTIGTLLHEMIHAYLWCTDCNRRDLNRDGHGPAFLELAARINGCDKERGVCITVYHNFHDEVQYHRRHVWRCSGPCQDRAPFYGYVQRSMNRPPQPSDRWFHDHQRNCGGTFTKLSDPRTPLKNIDQLLQTEMLCFSSHNQSSTNKSIFKPFTGGSFRVKTDVSKRNESVALAKANDAAETRCNHSKSNSSSASTPRLVLDLTGDSETVPSSLIDLTL